jgi:anaerobic selenocysteine-containing dehydrogenase
MSAAANGPAPHGKASPTTAASVASTTTASAATFTTPATPAPTKPGTTTVRTMCPMSCHPTLCGMLAEVRDGRLEAVRGDPDNPDSRGFLCVRGQASREVYGHPGRLRVPLVRDARHAPFRTATWDEALGRIVASMGAAPPAATAFWPGHGTFTTNYGTRIAAQLMARFANLHGSRFWNPTMICWGLGAFGLALTGTTRVHTKEDLGANANLVLLWGANLASQPNTGRHLSAARARGARIVAIDVRRTEAAAKADEVLIVRPGSDAALALALMHAIVAEGMHDAAFVADHTEGFAELADRLRAHSPQWAAPITGVPAARIVALARAYATTRPATIVLGGSSMHKGDNGWQAARAIACLPALAGHYGVPGGGLGPRHGGASHGAGTATIAAAERRAPGTATPDQMAAVIEALAAGEIRTLLLMGSNMTSSFADTNALAAGLARTRLVVGYDLFLNDTLRRFADVVLPSTAWLEELGAKATNTHLYLMPPALAPEGECRSPWQVLTALAARVGLADFAPWATEEAMVDAVLDHPSTGRATVAALRAEGGIRALDVSQVAYPDLRFDTPSGRVALWSQRARELGLDPLPSYAPDDPAPGDAAHPLVLTQGRTIAHFHGFYDNGRALPTLAAREPEPLLWLSPEDAAARGLVDGAAIRISNARGEMLARARVTAKIPAGTVWMRDGWPGLNALTGSARVLPDEATGVFGFSAGQARFDARVEVEAVG